MRKRGFLVMTMLVVMAMLFASCTSHLGEDENAAASKAVKINFAMIIDDEAVQKAVALHGGVGDFKFFYMATPQWKSASAIQGDTGGNYVEIDSDYAHMTDPEHHVAIGYFKPGLWRFDVVITSADGDADTAKDRTKVIYEANSTWKTTDFSLFNSSTRTVDLGSVPMVLYTVGAKATITLKLAVPKILTGTAPDVTLQLNGGGTVYNASISAGVADTKTGATYDAPPVSDANTTNWYYFTNTINNVIPGNYNLIFTYKDAVDGNKVGGASIFTTILPTDYTIWGTIENGEFQIATLTLNVDGVAIDFTRSADSVAAGGTITCSPTPTKAAGGFDSASWYVNGVNQTAGVVGSTGVFTFDTDSTTSTANPGTYEIVCKAQKGTAVTYSSHTVTVTPPAAISVTAPSSTVAQDGSLLFTAASTPADSTLQWYVKKDGVEVEQTGATGSTFTFNTSSTTYTTATPGEYEIILKATGNAGIGGGQTGYGSKFVTVVAP